MSTVTPPTHPPIGISYQPRPLPSAKLRWSERVNWRILVFVAVVAMPIALLFFWWLDEAISGGIHDYGAYKEVDLKAMSTFDMDQMNATMQDIPEKWRNLEGKKVLAVGEMWAPNYAGDSERLSYFQLVYSKTKCCFSGPPLAQHFVDGYVVKGAHVYYYDVPVKVMGTIHVYVRKDPTSGVIKSIYHVDVEKVTPIE
ncbi:MAG TPA: hypothetical protein VHX86_15045 [Tepidisphaeraceae bacterium]|jgi:hypothetical protein|nr:hypothetical protein [Tepidisphaeraceae bacterium]